MNLIVEGIGFAAGSLTMLRAVPQLIKVIKSKDTSGVSLYSWLLTSLGALLWVTYGLCIQSYALIMCDSVSLVLSNIIVLKLMKGK